MIFRTTFVRAGDLTAIRGALLNDQLNFKLDEKTVIPVGDDGTPVLPISYGTTYLPVGYLLGLGIDYEDSSKKVVITRDGKISANPDKAAGWYFINYTTDNYEGKTEKLPLMGTTSYMYDVSESSGGKNDLQMTHNRYDDKSGDLLAGITYRVIWTDPPSYLAVGDKPFIDYEIRTLSSKVWKLAQNSINFDQASTVYFSAPDGTNYFR